jgi:hypothetical protein
LAIGAGCARPRESFGSWRCRRPANPTAPTGHGWELLRLELGELRRLSEKAPQTQPRNSACFRAVPWLSARAAQGRGRVLEAGVVAARRIQPHRQGTAAAGDGHLGERIRRALLQPRAHRLGDALHSAEGSASSGGAGRGAAGEGDARGVSPGALNSPWRFELNQS